MTSSRLEVMRFCGDVSTSLAGGVQNDIRGGTDGDRRACLGPVYSYLVPSATTIFHLFTHSHKQYNRKFLKFIVADLTIDC